MNVRITVLFGIVSSAAAVGFMPNVGSTSTTAARAAEMVSSIPSPQQVAVRYVVEGEGNKARYRVRERLAGRDFDNDAIGETGAVTGAIALDKAGKIVAAESFFTAELAGLTSDQARRDNYLRTRLLRPDSFPTTTLRITEVRGLPSPLPKSGEAKFELVGDLTVKGVTRPTTWTVTATVNGNNLSGTAATRFTFADFQLPQPRVAIVLSLADTIGLEYDFVMVKK